MLTSVWILINTSQFFANIGLWQVEYTMMIKVVNEEIKRVANGEYLSYLKIKDKVAAFFGLSDTDGDDGEEKMG